MMTMILKDIKYYTKLMKRIYEYRISQLNETPKLAIIQVGNVEASNRYIRNKVKDCEEVGIIPMYIIMMKILQNKIYVIVLNSIKNFMTALQFNYHSHPISARRLWLPQSNQKKMLMVSALTLGISQQLLRELWII